jgi:hypothetical protein
LYLIILILPLFRYVLQHYSSGVVFWSQHSLDDGLIIHGSVGIGGVGSQKVGISGSYYLIILLGFFCNHW